MFINTLEYYSEDIVDIINSFTNDSIISDIINKIDILYYHPPNCAYPYIHLDFILKKLLSRLANYTNRVKISHTTGGCHFVGRFGKTRPEYEPTSCLLSSSFWANNWKYVNVLNKYKKYTPSSFCFLERKNMCCIYNNLNSNDYKSIIEFEYCDNCKPLITFGLNEKKCLTHLEIKRKKKEINKGLEFFY